MDKMDEIKRYSGSGKSMEELNEEFRVKLNFTFSDFYRGNLKLTDALVVLGIYMGILGFSSGINSMFSHVLPYHIFGFWFFIFIVSVFYGIFVFSYVLIGTWRCALNVENVIWGYLVRVGCLIGSLWVFYQIWISFIIITQIFNLYI